MENVEKWFYRSVFASFQLLDACVNNCGKPFKLEVASRDFEHNLKKLLSSRSHPKVRYGYN